VKLIAPLHPNVVTEGKGIVDEVNRLESNLDKVRQYLE
jgi:hypothetical protein